MILSTAYQCNFLGIFQPSSLSRICLWNKLLTQDNSDELHFTSCIPALSHNICEYRQKVSIGFNTLSTLLHIYLMSSCEYFLISWLQELNWGVCFCAFTSVSDSICTIIQLLFFLWSGKVRNTSSLTLSMFFFFPRTLGFALIISLIVYSTLCLSLLPICPVEGRAILTHFGRQGHQPWCWKPL